MAPMVAPVQETELTSDCEASGSLRTYEPSYRFYLAQRGHNSLTGSECQDSAIMHGVKSVPALQLCMSFPTEVYERSNLYSLSFRALCAASGGGRHSWRNAATFLRERRWHVLFSRHD